MKVYLNCYRRHWLSPYKICEWICFWREIEYEEPWVEAVNKVLEPVMTVIMNVMDVINPKINYVKIDRWDTWSMDHTLAYIVLPMLKQLQQDKHGSPYVEDEDVPEELRSEKKPKRKKKSVAVLHTHAVNFEDDDALIHKKWDYVLGEMIWAFEQKVKDDDENEFFDHTVSKGMPWDKDYVSPKVDWDGLKSHQARKTNGYRLFGKYYEGLWD